MGMDITWAKPSETLPAGYDYAITAADDSSNGWSSLYFPGYFQNSNQGLIFSHEGNPNELLFHNGHKPMSVESD